MEAFSAPRGGDYVAGWRALQSHAKRTGMRAAEKVQAETGGFGL